MPFSKLIISSLNLNSTSADCKILGVSRDAGKFCRDTFSIENVERSVCVKSGKIESNSSFLFVTFYQLYVIFFSIHKSEVNTILSYKMVIRYTLCDTPLLYIVTFEVYIVTFEVYFVTYKVCVGSVEIPYHKKRLSTSYLNIKIQGFHLIIWK